MADGEDALRELLKEIGYVCNSKTRDEGASQIKKNIWITAQTKEI